jgi:hypothetical protein
VVELAQTAAKGRHEMNEALPVSGTLSGVFWTWVVPIILFAIAFAATWLLYRHFANRNDDA